MIKTPKSIAVVGGGTAGFVSALILKKRFPQMKIDVIRSSKIGIIGVGEGSTEHWKEFLIHLGISNREVVRECDATFKCGIMFQNWGVPDYLHSIQTQLSGKLGQYPYVYAGLIASGAAPIDMASTQFWNNQVNRWFLTQPDATPTNQYHFNTNSLNAFLTKKAEQLGIRIYDDEINDFDITEDGNITTLHGTKKDYNYDFYIDSTGFKKILISKLGAKWQSYSKYLKMNSAIVFPTGDTDNYNIWTMARAMDSGWMFRIPVWGRHGNGYIYNSDYISADDAKLEAEKFLGYEVNVAKQISFDPGALDKVWINNCCAIGLSASFVEPLEASSIGTSIQQAFLLMHRIVNYDQDIIDSYNNDVTDILNNIRDFVALHYVTKRNDTPFWKDVQQLDLPGDLADKIERWRNRMPINDDFNRKSRFILFKEDHHLFIMHGLQLFDTNSIKQEFELQSIQAKLEVEDIIRGKKVHTETISTVTHKEAIRYIRQNG